MAHHRKTVVMVDLFVKFGGHFLFINANFWFVLSNQKKTFSTKLSTKLANRLIDYP